MKKIKDERGFTTFADFNCTYGTSVRVKESSRADGPHVWLFLEEDAKVLTRPTLGKASAHLTIEQAEELARALLAACKNHYQVR